MKLAALPRYAERDMVIPQLTALQFISIAVMGMTTPFFNLFLVDVGISATLVGTILSVAALLELILTPLLNTFADRWSMHRRLFILYMIMFAAANLIYANTHFTPLLIVAALMIGTTTNPSMTLGLQLTMTRLQQTGRDILGRIRSFAALGYALASLIATPLFNVGGYQLLFWIGAALAAITIQMSNVLPAYTASKEVVTQPPKRRRGFYVLAVVQFFVTMGIRAGYAFWLIHVTRNLGLSTAQIGIFMAFVAGVEVPFFMLMDPIIKRYNPRIIYIVGTLGLGLFFMVLGFIPNMFWLIILNLVRGAIWPMYNLPIFIMTSQISHPRNVATNQAIINVTVPSIAVLLTGSMAGWLFDTQAAWVFFSVCALACFVGAVIAIVGYRELEPIQLPADA